MSSDPNDMSAEGLAKEAPATVHAPLASPDIDYEIPLIRFLGVRMVTPAAPDVAVSMEMDRTDDVLNRPGSEK